jgi:hypothetical protein
VAGVRRRACLLFIRIRGKSDHATRQGLPNAVSHWRPSPSRAGRVASPSAAPSCRSRLTRIQRIGSSEPESALAVATRTMLRTAAVVGAAPSHAGFRVTPRAATLIFT